MPGPESGPGGPGRGTAFKDPEQPFKFFDINEALRRQAQDGGEVAPHSTEPVATESAESASSVDTAQAVEPVTAPGDATASERPAAQEGTSVTTITSPEAESPTPKDQTSQPLRVVLTSLDQNVDNFAREAAHEKLKQKREGPVWKRMASGAWNALTHEYQLVKATQEARQEILENNNLRHHQGKSDEQWREAVKMRWSSDYGEQLIHDGETFHKLNEPEAAENPNAQRMTADIGDLHRRAARGEFVDQESLDAEIDRLKEAWHDEGVSQEYIGEGQFLASNLAESCREFEGMINSAEGLSAVDKEALIEKQISQMEVITGEARVGSQTEIDATLSERIAEKLRNVPFLNEGRIAKVASALMNETVVAAMMTGAIYTAKRGVSAAGKIIAPGIGAGVVAAIRERNALIKERAFEARRADSGATAAEELDESKLSSGRRALRKLSRGKLGATAQERQAELNATQYESRSAGELIGDLNGLYNEAGELGIMNRADMERATSLIGQIRARIQIGDRTGARVINFADISPDAMESRRFDLDLAMAKVEDDMAKMMENPVAKAMLDIKPEENFKDSLEEQRAISEGMIMGEMQEKDQLFNKLVGKRAFNAALKGTIFGVGLSAAAHAWDAVHEAYTNVRGGVPQSDVAYTTAAYETSTANDTTPHIGSPSPEGHIGTPSGHVGTEVPQGHIGSPAPEDANGEPHIGTPEHGGIGESVPLSENSKINLPEGYKVESGSNGMVTITGPNGTEYGNLALNKDGSLSDSALDSLKSQGFSVSDQQEVIQGKPEVSHPTVTPNEFYENHKDSMKLIHRTKWIDGDTARSGLHEFTLHNSVDANGNVTISVQSLHGASGVNWQEAARDGHLKVYLSASRGTQSHGIEIQFGPDGKATIPNGSEARGLFDSNGVLKGTGFEEAALNGGQASDGGENIAVLATAVGNGDENIQDTITTPTLQTAHVYTMQAPQAPTHNTGFTNPEASSSTASDVAEGLATVAGAVAAGAAIGLGAKRALNNLKTAAAGAGGGSSTGGSKTGTGTPGAGSGSGRGKSGPGGRANTGGPGTGGPGRGSRRRTASNPNPNPNSANPQGDGSSGQANGGGEKNGPAMTREEKYFFDLDTDKLDTIEGYDPADYTSYSLRERKQAMRFLSRAISELGNEDKPKVVARALAMAEEALNNNNTGPLADLFKNTIELLQKSAARVEGNEKKGPKANEYIKDLDSETATFPFSASKGFNPDQYSPLVQKLVARIFAKAQENVGERPDPKVDPAGYTKWPVKVLRGATRIAHPDQYPDLSNEEKDLFSEAQKAFSAVKPDNIIYKK